MIDERVYNEYANWLLENSDFLKQLEKTHSSIFVRLHPVMLVLDHFYNKLIDDETYNLEEDNVFNVGFYYLADQIEEVKWFYKNKFEEDIKKLNLFGSEVNLFLEALELQLELIERDLEEDEVVTKAIELPNTIRELIDKLENFNDETYDTLGETFTKIYYKEGFDYYSVTEIFLEIADDYNLDYFYE